MTMPIVSTAGRDSTAHNFEFPRLGGGENIALSDFAGSAVLVVNVASACGYTPQYRELQQLYDAKSGKGLVVLGVPCNDFGRQEDSAEPEIQTFCAENYGVTFPMSGKIEIVNAERRHPFYAWIARELGDTALPKWNFHKYLLGKDGSIAASLAPAAAPLGPELLTKIKQTLCA